MKLNNDIEMEIHKTWYNKTKVQPDGITHIVDTEHQYPVYQFGMAKNYFDIEDKGEVVDCIIADLRSTIQQLEQLKKSDLEKDSSKANGMEEER